MNKINLWASPRNISTAIMYSFAQRKDMSVVDEPFYASYLTSTGIIHPGQEEILSSQSTHFDVVLSEVIEGKYSTPNVFFKQMSHHLLDHSKGFLLDCKNIILIRDPKEMIISFSKVIDSPSINESHEIFEFLNQNNHPAVMLDSNELLKNPKKVLNELCSQLDIPFDSSMLKWEKGKRIEDGVWAPHWYNNVHQSTGFKPHLEKEEKLPQQSDELLEECLPLYIDLQEHAIKA